MPALEGNPIVRVLLLALPLALIAPPVLATAPAARAAADRATARACRSVSGLKDARVEGGPVRFSDTISMDARLVRGIWPQPHMKGAKAQMLCLYDRRAHRAEVQEWPGPK